MVGSKDAVSLEMSKIKLSNQVRTRVVLDPLSALWGNHDKLNKTLTRRPLPNSKQVYRTKSPHFQARKLSSSPFRAQYTSGFTEQVCLQGQGGGVGYSVWHRV